MLTREEFWHALTPAEREPLRELADRKKGMGPLTFLAAWRTKREDG